MILWQLYASFFIVGVFCVGGGYASIPLIQAQVINLHHWMNMHEFMNVFAMSQTIRTFIKHLFESVA